MYSSPIKIKNDIEIHKFFLSEYNKRLTPEYTVNINNGQIGLMNEKTNIDEIISKTEELTNEKIKYK